VLRFFVCFVERRTKRIYKRSQGWSWTCFWWSYRIQAHRITNFWRNILPYLGGGGRGAGKLSIGNEKVKSYIDANYLGCL